MGHFEFLQHNPVAPGLACALAIAVSCVYACSSDDSGSSAALSGAPSSAGGGVGGSAVAVAGQSGSLAVSGGVVAISGRGGAAGAAGIATSVAGAGGVGGGNAGKVAGSGGSSGSSGSRAGTGGVAGRAGTGGMAEDECGAISTGSTEAATPKAVVLYALVEYHTTDENQFVGVHATLTVPAKPPPGGVIFVWPGTQTFPDGATVQPVGEGVLQPVLTWGNSCVPGALFGYDTWWISPVYVNDATSIPELNGCHGGSVITVDVGDRLDLDMRLDGTTWNQTVIDQNSKKSTKFSIDLRGQLQQRAIFEIELPTSAKPTEDVIFEDIVLTMRDPEPGACALNNRGTNDYATKSRVSADGLHCCIDRIVLRAEGVPATTKNPRTMTPISTK
jgi:hypothetical protein